MTAALEGGVNGQRHAPVALYPRERPGSHCTGGWAGPRAGLDGRKISSQRDSIPDRPAYSSVAIPTELPGPQHKEVICHKLSALTILWNKTELLDAYVLSSCTASYKFYLKVTFRYRNVPGFTQIVSA